VDGDWERFARAQRGDERAWRELTAEHQPRLAALALFVTGSTEHVDDIVQETFVRAFVAKLRNHSGTVTGYLGTIAYRLAVKESRRLRRNVALTDRDMNDVQHTPLDDVLLEERARHVATAIGRLSEEQRQVLILRMYCGHSYQEIARILRVPLGTVKSRIFNAVKSCRESLRRKGVVE
jgi:RNA polymerase sigma-70 factor (ECF subfamily)